MNELNEKCNKALKIAEKVKNCQLLKLLLNETFYIFKDIAKESGKDIEKVKDVARREAVDLSHDCIKYVSELKKFTTITENGIVFNFERCPFLKNVWKGDEYDAFQMDGIDAMVNDFSERSKLLLNTTSFCKHVMSKLQSDNDEDEIAMSSSDDDNE